MRRQLCPAAGRARAGERNILMNAQTPSDPDDREPTREEIDRMKGPVLLEFGTSW